MGLDDFKQAWDGLMNDKDDADALQRIGKSHDDMAAMSHDDLLELRSKFKDDDKPVQNILAPYEHRAFARESVKGNPLNAVAMPAMIPGYEAAKAVGYMKGRSDPSLESVKQGFIGVGEGIRDAVTGKK